MAANHTIGDLLLFTLSGWESASWPKYCKAFDYLAALPDVHYDYDGQAPALARWRAMQTLDMLGHCDCDLASDDRSVRVAPPTLVRLPLPGAPTAVVAGARWLDTAAAVRQAAATISTDIRVDVSHCRFNVFSPAQITVTARSSEDLLSLAERLAFHASETPSAWTIAKVAASIEEYEATLSWSSQPEIDWPKQDFDIVRLGFLARGGIAQDVRLTKYVHPAGYRTAYYLWEGGRSARVDPDWGRYLLLSRFGKRPLLYDWVAGVAACPIGAPLPRLLGRALALASGSPPRESRVSGDRAIGSPSGSLLAYSAISPQLVQVVAEKLGVPSAAAYCFKDSQK